MTAPWLTAQKAVKFGLKTTTLDGEGQTAKGTLKVVALKQPAQPGRGDILGTPYWFPRLKENETPRPDPAKPISWELGDVMFGTDFATNGNGLTDASTLLPAGIYRAILETTDKFGKPVTARFQFTVVNPGADKFAVRVPNHIAAPKWTVEPGEEFVLLWGSGYDAARAYIEVEHKGKVIKQYWTEAG